VPLWIEAQETDDFSPKEFEGGTITSIIKDYEIDSDKRIATFLIEVSDKNAPNASYTDHDKRTVRHLVKDEPEGNGFSAHVMFSLDSNSKYPNTYLTLIEAVPSVSAYRIQSMLNDIINRICKSREDKPFQYVPPTGDRKTKTYIPHIILAGHPSENFHKDIEEGRITGLTLVAPKSDVSLGGNPFIRMNELSAKVSISRDIPKGERWDAILTGVAAKKSEFPIARIFLQPEKNGKAVHVDIDTSAGKIIGDAYIKTKRLIDFEKALDTSAAEEISPHLVKPMKIELVKERGDVT